MKRDVLHMRIDASLKQRLREIARQENRGLSNLVETALKDFVKTYERSR